MKVLSLFSGIGAFEKALSNLNIDYELAGFSEIDKWAIQSYCAIHGIDETLNLGDVSKITESELPKNVDMVTYGFPCQDISIAGQQKGICKATRSGLLYEAERVIEATKPKYAIAENVKNLVGKRFKDDFEDLLQRLDKYGYNSYWQTLNAKDYGVPQNRERVFIVSIRKDIDTGDFTFPTSQRSDKTLKELLETTTDIKYDMTQTYIEYLQPKGNVIGEIDIKGTEQVKRVYGTGGVSPTLDTMQGGHREPKIKVERIPDKSITEYEYKENKYDMGNRVYHAEGISPTLTTNGDIEIKIREATKKGYAIATEEDSINISFPNSKTRRGRVGKGVAQTLDTQCNQAVLQDYKIRKLTPLECWRLMGFDDDDYWKARRRLEEQFYNGNDRSNSQMYKQAGNSIVVPVLEEIFKQLLKGECK